VRIYPAASVVHNNLGSAYFALGRYEEAVASFKEAARLDPGFAQAHFNLGLMYIKQGRPTDAARALDEAAKGFTISGDENLKAGLFEDAEEDFKSLLLIDPEFYPGQLKLGMVYAAARRHKEAVEIFERLTRQHPTRWEAHRHLGETLYALGKYAKAAEQLQQAVTLNPNAPEAHYHLGKTYLKLQRPDLALAESQKLRDLKDTDRANTLQELASGTRPQPKQ
jgi:tetratricopeptide (TPR) repeat protein